MKINIENLIEIVIKEVIAELTKIGVDIDFSIQGKRNNDYIFNNKKQNIDMSNYKTPILTENILESINPEVNEIVIPKGTIFTPGAWDVLKKRNFIISYN